jgi:hypothetical protein
MSTIRIGHEQLEENNREFYENSGRSAKSCTSAGMNFSSQSFPRCLNHTDHGLPAGMNVNVLDRDLLRVLPL